MDKQLIKGLNKETKESSYFKKFNRRRYASPKGYLDADTINLVTARELYIYRNFYTVDRLSDNFTQANSFAILLDAYQQDYKTMYLDKTLLEAFIKTQPPADTTKLKKIVPTGLLILPPIIKFPDNSAPVKWIMFRHSQIGEAVTPIDLAQGGSFGTDINKYNYLSWFTVLDDKLKTQYTKNIRLSDNYRADPDYNNYIYDPIPNVSYLGEFLQTEAKVANLITDVLIQSLLYIQTNEDVVFTKKSSSKPAVDSSKPSRQKLKPYVIGEGFKPAYLRADSHSESKGGTKATHWRRGHYRWQPYGTKDNPQYKSIWIEPVLINQSSS